MIFQHDKFTALCVLLNSESGMSTFEYDEHINMLYLARCELQARADKKGCLSCSFFEHGCKKADGKMPPDSIQKIGCEQYENKHDIPW